MALLNSTRTALRPSALGTLLAVSGLALALGCGSSTSNPGDRTGTTNGNVTLSPASTYVTVGTSKPFTFSSPWGGGATYSVFPPSLGTVDGSGNFTASATPGTGTVVAMWTQDVRYTASAAVSTVPPPATPVVSAPATEPDGQAGCTASVATQAGCTYAWTVTGATVTAGSGTNQITFTAGTTGSISFSVVVTNLAGTASAPGTASTSILTGPTATVTAAAYVTADQAGYTASVPAQSGVTYAWTATGASITAGATTSQITFTPTASGTVNLSATLTDAAGSNTGTASCTIVPAPVATVTAPAYIAASQTGYTASVPIQSGSTYAWTVTGGTVTAGAGTNQITFTAGTGSSVGFSVVVTNEAGTVSAAGIGSSSIVGPPVSTVTAPATVNEHQAGYTASVPTQPGSTYAWTVTNGTVTAGAGTRQVTFTPGASGSVGFSVVVTNALGTVSAAGTASSTINIWVGILEDGSATQEAGGTAIAPDAFGNVFVVGYPGAMDGNSLIGAYDASLWKYNSAGVREFTVAIGAPGADVYAYGVATDASGNVYVAGYTDGGMFGNTLAGIDDGFLAKYDGAGNLLWGRQFGSGGDTEAVAVLVDANGDVYVGGNTSAGLDGHTQTGTYDLFVVKYNSAGVMQSTWQYGYPGDTYNPHGMAMDLSGNVYFTGETSNHQAVNGNTVIGNSDLWLVKLDHAGVWQFTKEMGVAGAHSGGNGVATDQLGNVIVTGRTGGNLDGLTLNAPNYACIIVKFNAAGTSHQTFALQGAALDTLGYGVTTDSNNNIYVGGSTASGLNGNPLIGALDFFVAKYDSTVALQWVRETGPVGLFAGVEAVAVDAYGTAYIAGWTQGGLGTNTLIGYRTDLFLATYTSAGALR